jgi:uncharacterized protein YjbI with pentapeptide repeats
MTDHPDAFSPEEPHAQLHSTSAVAQQNCPVTMPFSGRQVCNRKLFPGKQFCFWHLNDQSKFTAQGMASYFGAGLSLRDAIEIEVRAARPLDNALLANANFGGSFIGPGPDLRSGRFNFADFRGSSLSYSNLENTTFAGANLSGAKLSECKLAGANFYKTRLFRTKFRANDFSKVRGLTRFSFRGFRWGWLPIERISEEYPDQAIPMYLELIKHFSSRGMFDDASWAAYRASRLKHGLLRKRLSIKQLQMERFNSKFMPGLFDQQAIVPIEWFFAISAWLGSTASLVLIGYGERPSRVVLCAAFAISAYAGIYALPCGPTQHQFAASLYFSIVTFTTLGYGDIVPLGLFRLAAGTEALLGILLTGLFLFCLGRRTVSRN